MGDPLRERRSLSSCTAFRRHASSRLGSAVVALMLREELRDEMAAPDRADFGALPADLTLVDDPFVWLIAGFERYGGVPLDAFEGRWRGPDSTRWSDARGRRDDRRRRGDARDAG